MIVSLYGVITLTPSELAVARLMAERRQSENDRVGVIDRRGGGAELHYTGMCAELAFCRLLGAYPDFTDNPRAGGADCRVGKISVDVKASLGFYRTVTIPESKGSVHNADAIVVMRGIGATWRWLGWTLTSQVINADRLIDGYYTFPTRELSREIEKLRELGIKGRPEPIPGDL